MPAPSRVVFVVEYYFPHVGGGEVAFQQLAEGLATRGIDVHMVTCRLPNTAREESTHGVHVHRVKVPRVGRRHWFSLLALPQVVRLTNRDTVIHTTTHNGAFPAWLGAKIRGARCVMTVYEVFGRRWSGMAGLGTPQRLLFRGVEALAVNLPFDHQICISRFTQRSLAETYGTRRRVTSVIYLAVDTQLFDPAKQACRHEVRAALGMRDRFVVLFFGRPGYSKGLSYLIDAMPEISRRDPQTLFVFLLTDEPRNLYDQAMARLREPISRGEARVLPPVARADLPDYLSASDCVVIPSLSEGFGLSAAEACAMDCSVVATTGGALPEVVSGNCLLVPPRDSVAISDAVATIAAGNVAELPSHDFSWQRTIDQHMRVYESLASRRCQPT